MIPKSRTERSGRTSANSTIVWPSASRSLCGVLTVFICGVWCSAVFVGGPRTGRGPPEGTRVLLDRVSDAADHGRDVRPEQDERGEEDKRDHREDHGVRVS